MRKTVRYFEPTIITVYRIIDPILVGMVLYGILQLYSFQNVVASELSLIIALLVSVVFTYKGVYRSWKYSSKKEEFKIVLESFAIVFLIFSAFIYLFKVITFCPRRAFIIFVFITPILIVGVRKLFNRICSFIKSKNNDFKHSIIVGTGIQGIMLLKWLENNSLADTKVIGFFNGVSEKTIEGYPVLGMYEEVPDYVKKNEIDTVYIALPMKHSRKTKWLFSNLIDSTASVYYLPDLVMYDVICNSSVRFIENTPIISLVESPLSGFNSYLKRIEDIIFSLLLIFLSGPIMLLIAIIIKVTSKGSILFKQWRYGLNGNKIRVWKFRTMHTDEDGFFMEPAKDNDERITVVGRFLRKYSLDELPQFFNVLFGDLSIVGPRPHAISMVEEYRKQVNGAMLRHKIKPGITGLAQLYATRGIVDTKRKLEERIFYDMNYIKKWSIWLDLKIILLTPFYVFKERNKVV